MKYYRYKRIAPDGRVDSGVIQMPYKDTMSVISHLERDGSVTLFVRPLGALANAVMRVLSWKIRRRLPRPVLAEILSNLALMLKSGMPLVSAVSEVAAGAESKQVRKDLEDIIKGIQSGLVLSEVAAKYPYLFPKTVVHLIRMGEETGRLDKMLKDASDHLKRIHSIISDTKQALMYPAMVFVAIGGGLTFWLYYVVPKITGLFKEMGLAMPAITIWLVGLSDLVRRNILLILALIVLAAVLGWLGRRSSSKFRKTINLILLRVPVAKSILSAANLAFMSEYLSMLLNAGIDLLQALKIVIDSVNCEVCKEKLNKVRQAISRGDVISDAFRKATIFPPFVVRMIAVGELSGNLTEQLDTIASEYRGKLRILVATLGKLIEPAVLVIAGSVFAVIIVALLLPIYDLLGKLG